MQLLSQFQVQTILLIYHKIAHLGKDRVDALVSEFLAGGCSFKQDKNGFYRMIEIVKIKIISRDSHILCEKRVIHPDGTEKDVDRLPRKKVYIGMLVHEALMACMHDDLGFAKDSYSVKPEVLTMDTRESRTYPGIQNIRTIHTFTIALKRDEEVSRTHVVNTNDGLVHHFSWTKNNPYHDKKV